MGKDYLLPRETLDRLITFLAEPMIAGRITGAGRKAYVDSMIAQEGMPRDIKRLVLLYGAGTIRSQVIAYAIQRRSTATDHALTFTQRSVASLFAPKKVGNRSI